MTISDINFFMMQGEFAQMPLSVQKRINRIGNGKCNCLDAETFVFVVNNYKIRISPASKKFVIEEIEGGRIDLRIAIADVNLLLNKNAATYKKYHEIDLQKALDEIEITELNKINDKKERRKKLIAAVDNRFFGLNRFKIFLNELEKNNY